MLLLVPVLLLIALGIVMVGSASVAVAESLGLPSGHYLLRHLIYLSLGLVLAAGARVIPIKLMETYCRTMFPLALLALPSGQRPVVSRWCYRFAAISTRNPGPGRSGGTVRAPFTKF